MAMGSLGLFARVLLNALSLGMPPVAQSGALDTATVCLVDAATRAPVIGVEVRVEPARSRTTAPDTIRATTFVVRTRSACVRVPVGELRARRVGYREVRHQLPSWSGSAPQRLAKARCKARCRSHCDPSPTSSR